MAATRQASLVVKRMHKALARSVASALEEATASPSPSTCPQGVGFQRPRPGDDAFLTDSVACASSATREEFSSALETAVVEMAAALLT